MQFPIVLHLYQRIKKKPLLFQEVYSYSYTSWTENLAGYRATKSQTQLKQLSMQHMHAVS